MILLELEDGVLLTSDFEWPWRLDVTEVVHELAKAMTEAAARWITTH